MKAALVTLLVMMAVVPGMHAAAYAYDNRAGASYESGSGSSSWERGRWDSSVLSYTRFFRPVEDLEGPYGEREFLQHPPRIDFSIRHTKQDSYYDGVNIAPSGIYNLEFNTTVYTLSGISYLGYKDRTGLGLRLKYSDSETSGDWNGAVKEKSMALTVQHYLTERLRIEVDYEKRNPNADWARTLNIYSVSAVALIDFYRVEGWYSNLDSYKETIGIGFGVYPFRELGVSGSYETTYGGIGTYSTTLTLGGEYFVTPAINLDLEYKWMEENAGKSRADAVMLGLGSLF